MLKKIKKKDESTRKYIYRTIKQSIVDFYFIPGDKIDEQSISIELGVSRTPVREALILLENEKLLTILPKKGTFISKINLNDAKDFLAMRHMIESNILEYACISRNNTHLIELSESLNAQKVLMNIKDSQLSLSLLDNAYHKLIFKISGNSNIWNSLQRIGNPYNQIRSLVFIEESDFTNFFNDNSQLFTIIETQNLELLIDYQNKKTNILDIYLPKLLDKYPTYFCLD